MDEKTMKVLSWLKWILLAIAGLIVVGVLLKEVKVIWEYVLIFTWSYIGYCYIFEFIYQMYNALTPVLFSALLLLTFFVIMRMKRCDKKEMVGAQDSKNNIWKAVQRALYIAFIVFLSYSLLDTLLIVANQIYLWIFPEYHQYMVYNYETYEYVLISIPNSVIPQILKRFYIFGLGVLFGVGGIFLGNKSKKRKTKEQEVAVSEEKIEEKAE